MSHRRTTATTGLRNNARDEIVDAIEQGDNRAARLLANKALSLADSTSAEREVAEDALRRTDVDRPTVAAAMAAFALIFFLAIMFIAPIP